MKYIIVKLSFLFVISFQLATVDAQCMKVIPSYYECYSNEIELNDEFYQSQLELYTTFDQAMDYFRSLYLILASCDISNGNCDCFRAKMSSEPDYALFFTNTSYFNDLKKIAWAIKSKYRLR